LKKYQENVLLQHVPKTAGEKLKILKKYGFNLKK